MSSSRRLPSRVVRNISVANRLNNNKSVISKPELIKYIKDRAGHVYGYYNLNNINRENFNNALFENRVSNMMTRNLNKYSVNSLRRAARHVKLAASNNSNNSVTREQMGNAVNALA